MDVLKQSLDFAVASIDGLKQSSMRPGLAERYRAVRDRLVKLRFSVGCADGADLLAVADQLLEVDIGTLLPRTILASIGGLRRSARALLAGHTLEHFNPWDQDWELDWDLFTFEENADRERSQTGES